MLFSKVKANEDNNDNDDRMLKEEYDGIERIVGAEDNINNLHMRMLASNS